MEYIIYDSKYKRANSGPLNEKDIEKKFSKGNYFALPAWKTQKRHIENFPDVLSKDRLVEYLKHNATSVKNGKLQITTSL